MRKRSVTCLNAAGSHEMAYMEWGPVRAERTVLCVHGLTRNGRDFDPLAMALAEKGWRVVCPDVVGRGRSDWLSNGMLYGYPQYLADLNTLLARLDCGPVDWIGTSMGGLIGMLLAGQQKAAIRSLVMNDVGPLVPAEALKRIGAYVGQEHRFETIAEVEAHLRLIHAPFGDLTDGQWVHLARHTARSLDDGGFGLAYDPAIAAPFKTPITADIDLWGEWDKVGCPVLVVRGESSDLLLAETAERMATRAAPTRIVTMAGCGHAPALMSQDQIEPVVSWIEAIEPVGANRDFAKTLEPFQEEWPWLGGDLQTIRNRLRRVGAERLAGANRLEFEMLDGSGDRLVGALSQPPGGGKDRPLALLIHGLTGCEDSRYVLDQALHLLDRGMPVLRLNLRGAGPARKLCRFQYHAGRSEDIRAVIDLLDPSLVRNGVVAVGFSLGGNTLLKMLGEDAADCPLTAAVSICAPFDLAAAQRRIMQPRNWLYHRFFIKRMKNEALEPISEVSAEDRERIVSARTVFDFDNQFVAPRNGFGTAENYYETNSAEHYLGRIACPTLLIAANNDPIIPIEMYRRQRWGENPVLVPVLSEKGGHCGYHARGMGQTWADDVTARFLIGD